MFANGFLISIKMVGRVIAALLPDIFFLGGATAIIWGLHLWSVPLAFVVGGTMALLFGLMAVRKR